MTKKSGYWGFFTPYVWMFIQSYEKMRNYLYEQAKIETIKNNISKLNSELYLKQQELVKVSANAEKLSGEKAMISERSKYNSEDVKLHDNIISLKEKILKIESQISALNKEIESEKSNNKVIGEKLNNTEIKLSEIEKIVN